MRELFAFAFGVIIMIAVVTIFSSSVSPELEKYSVNEQSYSLLFHIHSLFQRTVNLARETTNTSVVVYGRMPAQLADNDYRLFIEDSQLCLVTRGDTIINNCINITLAGNYSGNFLSGTDLIINGSLVNDTAEVVFDNYAPTYEPTVFYDCDLDSNYKPSALTDSIGSIPNFHEGVFWGHNYSVSGSAYVCRVDVLIGSATGSGALQAYITQTDPTTGFTHTSYDGRVEVSAGQGGVYSITTNKQVSGEFYVIIGFENDTETPVYPNIFSSANDDDRKGYLCDEAGVFGGIPCASGMVDEQWVIDNLGAPGIIGIDMIVHASRTSSCDPLCSPTTYCQDLGCNVWPLTLECTEDSDCNDGNPCSSDACVDNECNYSNLTDGFQVGCNNTEGCSGSPRVCACISGTCISTYDDGTCQTWENYSNSEPDCGVCGEYIDFCNETGWTWFYGAITRDLEYNLTCPCCGDDGSMDTFYNGTIGSDATLCYEGTVTTDLDSTQESWCENVTSYRWLTGSTGNNSPCCGDDGSSDDGFYNDEYYCLNGGLVGDRDQYQGFCDYSGYEWFTSVSDGFFSPCCGDDTIFARLYDYFWNSSHMCLDGAVTTNRDYRRSWCESDGHEWFIVTEAGDAWPVMNVSDSVFNDTGGVFVSDVDGDGDNDVIAMSDQLNDVAWFENINGDGSSWTNHTIDFSNYYSKGATFSADVDGDGDDDIVVAGVHVAWFENTDGLGNFSSIRFINDFRTTHDVFVADMDADGDNDVLAPYYYGVVEWYENNESDGSRWVSHVIDSSFDRAVKVFPADFNGDGYLDVVSMNTTDGVIVWWENTDHLATSWTRHNIIESFGNPGGLFVSDIDSDFDLDFVATSDNEHNVTWFENINGLGCFSPHFINSSHRFAQEVFVRDIDFDGDMDVAVSDSYNIYWYENSGSGSSWSIHRVNDEVMSDSDLFLEDVDGDGDLDFVAAVSGYGDPHSIVKWWNNPSLIGSSGPCCGDDSVNDDFYNGSISTTTDFCQDGVFVNQGLDDNQALCEQYDYEWIDSSITDNSFLINESFTDTPDGSLPSDWTGLATGASVISSHSGRTKVLELESGGVVYYYLPYEPKRFVLNYTYLIDYEYGRPLEVYNSSGGLLWRIRIIYNDLTYYDGTNDYSFTSSDAISDDTWYDFSVVADVDSGLSFYLNGVEVLSDYQVVGEGNASYFSFKSRNGYGENYIDDVVFSGPNNPSCCGDDLYDHFYNSTLGDSSNFCYEGTYLTEGLDDNQGLCGFYGYDWFSGALTGSNGPCCGDDGVNDVFYNDSHLCVEGVLTMNRDFNQSVCEAGGYSWFKGSNQGINDPCCGDDYVWDGYWDDFYNSTHLCYEGVIGTDGDLSKGFCEYAGEAWLTYSGASLGSQNSIGSLTGDSRVINMADLDADGDKDLLALYWAATPLNLSWWENVDDASSWTKHNIIGGVDSSIVHNIITSDFDRDDDQDIILGYSHGSEAIISYFENDGSGSFTETNLYDSAGVLDLSAADINGDSYTDLVMAHGYESLSWWMNDGSGSFSEQFIRDLNEYIDQVFTGDFNGDDTMDIIYMASINNTVFLSNNDGFGGNWTSTNITVFYNGTYTEDDVSVADVDGDGDLDFVVDEGGSYADETAWFSNNGLGTSFTKHLITDTIYNDLFVTDLDGDGDVDVIAAGGYGDFEWFENNGDGSSWTKHVIDNLNMAQQVFTVDVDGDNLKDVVIAKNIDPEYLAWYKNQGVSGGFNGPCCGDDSVSDDFYNDTILNGTFCLDGRLEYDVDDTKRSWCESEWFTWMGGDYVFEDYFDTDADTWAFNNTGSYDSSDGSPHPGSIWFDGSGTSAAYDCFSSEILNGDTWRVNSSWRDGTYNNFDQPLPYIRIRKGCGLTGEVISECRPVDCTTCTFGRDAGSEFTNAWAEEWHLNNDPDCVFTYSGADYSGQFTIELVQDDWQTADPLDDPEPYFDTILIYADESLTGNNDACCGDDSLSDNFYNATHFCSYGSLISSRDAEYIEDWLGDHVDYSTGRGVCEIEYSWMENDVLFDSVSVFTDSVLFQDLRLGDIDGDGDLDVIAGEYTGPGVAYPVHKYVNDGSGSFTRSAVGRANSWVKSLYLGDVDGDGDLDFVTGDDGGYLYKWINDGSGVFDNSSIASVGGCHVALADLDGNNTLDIAAGCPDGHVYTLFNYDGLGNYSSSTDLGSACGAIKSVAVGDLDNDTAIDIVTVDDCTPGHVYKWVNNGTGGFSGVDLGQASADIFNALSLGDIDGDGDLDIIHDYFSTSGPLEAWFNNGTGGFGSPASLGTTGNDYVRELSLGDLDSDADLDLVTADDEGKLYKWINDGSGSFTVTYANGYPIVSAAYSLDVGDVDGSGDLDLVTSVSGELLKYVNHGLNATAGSGPCCESGDTFTNDTHSCCNGVFQSGSCS